MVQSAHRFGPHTTMCPLLLEGYTGPKHLLPVSSQFGHPEVLGPENNLEV